MTNIGWSLKTGLIAALIGGGITYAFGGALIAGFGLFAFAKIWALYITVLGIGITGLSAIVFLPIATIVAGIVTIFLTRHHFSRFAIGPYMTTLMIAFLLLSAVSIPATLLLSNRVERLDKEARQLQQAQTAVRTDVVKITDLSASAVGETLRVQPELTGMLPGQYEARLTVSDRVPLVTRTTTVQLPQQTAALAWSIPFAELGQAYRQKILINQSARVHVASTFSVAVELELITPQDSTVTTLLPPQSPERSSDARSSIKLDIGQI